MPAERGRPATSGRHGNWSALCFISQCRGTAPGVHARVTDRERDESSRSPCFRVRMYPQTHTARERHETVAQLMMRGVRFILGFVVMMVLDNALG